MLHCTALKRGGRTHSGKGFRLVSSMYFRVKDSWTLVILLGPLFYLWYSDRSLNHSETTAYSQVTKII